MIIPEIVYSTLTNTCPRCHKGKVFKKDNPYHLKQLSAMHEQCDSCGLVYEREPGFFYGAMYVSYALMSGWLIIWFLADLLWFRLEAMVLASGMTVTMILIAPLFFHWSRLIWLNFFVRYDKNFQKKNNQDTSDNKPIYQK